MLIGMRTKAIQFRSLKAKEPLRRAALPVGGYLQSISQAVLAQQVINSLACDKNHDPVR